MKKFLPLHQINDASATIFFMINRALLRIKIIQILYSYYKGDGQSISLAEKELFFSIEKTYELYFHLLQFSIEITHYAANKIDARRNKLRPTEEDLHPNTRFIDNRFVAQLSRNSTLQEFLKENKTSWVNNQDAIKSIYELIVASEIYADYMSAETADYTADKDIWPDDLEIVISFIIKTIKRFDTENGVNQELLPMFKDDEDAEFASVLIKNALENETVYRKMIDQHTNNWELDRIAFMDIIIMQAALAEIMTFPTIPVNVTLNEYIEISKSFSTDKSATFINGVLDNIVKELKADNKLIKVVKI